ncbi:MAG: type II toxin-antitoxin system VapC family toxin [Deltaproteobacteria bacterium]|nr:type II toxin-antitoxin system VapC family toxin [Deltaproteobacteria bacterium]
MIGLDTNVVVRYLTQDDARQSRPANRLLESLTSHEPGYISLIVLVELVWVLEDAYGASRGDLAITVEMLLQTESLVLQEAESVWRALAAFRRGTADFADQLIAQLNASAGCGKTYTFDKAAARDAGMTLLS